MTVTTSTEYGRAKIAWPDFNHEGGVALHGKVTDGVEALSDHLDSRFMTEASLAPVAVRSFVHNMNATASGLEIVVYVAGVKQTPQDQKKKYPITFTDANTIEITNNSGSAALLSAVVARKKTWLPRHYYLETINAAPVTACAYAVPDDKSAIITFVISARVSGIVSASFEIKVRANNQAGTASAVEISRLVSRDNDAIDVTISTAGNTVSCLAVGLAATTIVWNSAVYSSVE
jgi:hypothetical protein